MKNFFILIILLFLSISYSVLAQLDSVFYQGPAVGSEPSGVMVTLSTFRFDAPVFNNIIADRNLPEPFTEPQILQIDESNLPVYTYVEDTNAGEYQKGATGQTIILNKWSGIPMGNSIPPDPIMAAGPDHVIACVNSQFRVWDKAGNLLANVNADGWISPVIGPGAFDPQIIYDHYAGRWFMLWDWQNSSTLQAYFIISYSDDADPFGTWYMYKLDAKLNGTQNSNTWGDYPQIGYDAEAIYINSRSFTFASAYLYNRIRILSKSELYSSNGGLLTWKDIWNIGRPGSPSVKPDVLEPAISYTTGYEGYFFNTSTGGANYYLLYKMLNPISSTPRLRGKVIPVQLYYAAPDAQQLGGGMAIDGGGSKCRHHPYVRDGFLYAAHSIRNSTIDSLSSIKYVKLDLNTQSIIDQSELGSPTHFYLYPALAIDQNHNVAITFSRSGYYEYCGAYFSSKHASSPSGLSPSIPIQEGLGNYVVTFGGTRNRWGDYMGIYLDPVNEFDIWTFTEYAAATNTWGTYVGQLRMAPYAGIYSFLSPSLLDFGDVEVNTVSNSLELIIANYGIDDLVISEIAENVGPFNRVSSHSFPLTLQTYDTLIVEINFSPTQVGDFNEILPITSNDPNLTGPNLTGHCYIIQEAYTDIFYASTGTGNNGDILLVSRETGTGTTLGNSLFSEVKRLAANPTNNLLYGIVNSAGGTDIVRVNAGQGDAYSLYTLNLLSVSGIAFDTTGTLYVAQQNGDIYTVDLTNGNYTFVTHATSFINSIAFRPSDNTLWASLYKPVGLGKDSIFTIDLFSGTVTHIGTTGFSVMTNDLTFDENDLLFGVIGTSISAGKLISINTTDGTGTEIGSIGFNHVVGLAFSLNGPVSSLDEENEIIPLEFSLKQNYPNPFNPSTVIEYSVPYQSDVKLVVYNLLGQEVLTLVDEVKPAGNYKVSFDASKFNSGVYFYRLEAGSFTETRKMVLIK